KSEIEKNFSYQIKDRVFLGILLFIIYIVLIVFFTFEEMVKITKEFNLIITIATILFVTIIMYILVVGVMLLARRFLFKNKKTIYKVRIFDSKPNEFWTLCKITKDNKAIIKNDESK